LQVVFASPFVDPRVACISRGSRACCYQHYGEAIADLSASALLMMMMMMTALSCTDTAFALSVTCTVHCTIFYIGGVMQAGVEE
jgi:hypothetical protein